MPIKLLFSCRDAAAAHHFREVWQWSNANKKNLELHMVAQGLAGEILALSEIPFRPIDLPAVTSLDSPGAEPLLAAARETLLAVKPDGVLCGLSAPFEGGIDEALLATAPVPTFMLQDFWGESNNFFGQHAQHIFLIDEHAKKITMERYGIEGIVTGSPKHIPFQRLAAKQTKQDLRAQLKIAPEAQVVLFCGQGLHHLPGYLQTVSQFSRALKAVAGQCRVIYRPHPRETPAECQVTLKTMKAHISIVETFPQLSIQELLTVADLSTALFSNSLYDSAYVNYSSTSPSIVPMALLFNAEIREYLQTVTTFDCLPYACDGLTLGVFDEQDLVPTIQRSLAPQTREEVWRNAQTHLKSPALSAANIINKIIEICLAKEKTNGPGNSLLSSSGLFR